MLPVLSQINGITKINMYRYSWLVLISTVLIWTSFRWKKVQLSDTSSSFRTQFPMQSSGPCCCTASRSFQFSSVFKLKDTPSLRCCVLGPRLPRSRALERLTTGLGTTSRVGEIKPSFKVESVVIFHYLPTRSVTTYGTVKSVLSSSYCEGPIKQPFYLYKTY